LVVSTLTRQFDAIGTTTVEEIRPELGDNIFKGNAVTAFLWPKRKVHTGGTSLLEPVLYGKNESTKWLTNPYDTVNTTAQEGMSMAQYAWRHYTLTTVISQIERNQNAGKSQIIDLVTAKLNQTRMTAREDLDREICQLNTSKDPSSLLGLDDIIANPTSGTFTDTLGGIASSTYPWWRNQVLDPAATGIGTSFAKFSARLWALCMEGTEKPTIIMCSKNDIYPHWEGVMSGQQRITSKAYNDLGFDNFMYKSAPVIGDGYIQADSTAGGSIYFINQNALTLHTQAGGDMDEGNFVTAVTQLVTVSIFLLTCQLTTNNRRRHGTNQNSASAVTATLTTWG